MAVGAEFPAFLKLEHRPDGQARKSFLSEIAAISGDAKQQFERSFGEIGQIVSRSLAGFNGGKFGLNLDLSGLKQAAADAGFAAERLRTMRDAARELAQSTGDISSETQRYIQALSAQTTEAERAKAAADGQVATYSRLQAGVDKLVGSNERLSVLYKNAEMARAATMAAQLRAELDPLFAAQQKYNAEMEKVNHLLQLGALSTDTYNAAQTRAKAQLDAVKASLAAVTAEEARMASAASALRSALDPTLAIQRAFDVEMSRADDLLRAGAISAREYAAAQQLARDNLQGAWQQLTQNNAALEVQRKRGTDAYGAVTNSVLANRVAMVQAGQQLQDMAIQFQAGTRASTIFAQQLPQLAFAFSGMEGKVGAVARTLSGPWSLALVAGSALLGGFLDGLIRGADGADKLANKSLTLSDALGKVAQGSDAALKALREYNSEQDTARKNTESMIKLNLDEAESQLKVAIAIREKIKAQIDLENQTNRGVPGYAGSVGAASSGLVGPNDSAIAALQKTIQNLRIQDAARDARAAVDPIAAINQRFDDMAEAAKRAADANVALSFSLKGTLIGYERQRKAALEAERARNKPASARDRQYGREIDSAAARSIAAGAGFQVNSADRTLAQQQRLYDDWIKAGKPKDNPVAFPSASAPHVRGNALDIQFGKGVSPASIRKAFEDEGVRLTKILKERGHFHIEWSTKGADKAVRETQQLEDYAARTAETIQRINERFDEQPRFIDQAAAATRELDDIISKLGDEQPPGFQKMIEDARAAKDVIEDALVRPFQQLAEDSERRIQIQSLLARGREEEAAALQDIWRLEEQIGKEGELRAKIADLIAQGRESEVAVMQRLLDDYPRLKQEIRDRAYEESRVTRELEAQREVLDIYLGGIREVRGELEALFSGEKVNFGRIFKQVQAKLLVKQVFGDALQGLEDYVRKNTFGPAVDELTSDTLRASDAIGAFADAAANGASRLNSSGAGDSGASDSLRAAFDAVFSGDKFGKSGQIGKVLDKAGGGPANDNGEAEIVVNGIRRANAGTLNAMSPNEYFTAMGASLVKPLLGGLNELLGTKLFSQLEGVLGGAFGGYATGGVPGGILGALKGIKGLPEGVTKALDGALKGAGTGTAVAGIGNALGLGLSNTGAQIGGAIGSFLPIPGGDIIGAIAGGLIGKLFKSTKKGYSVISNTGVTGGGNSADLRASTAETGGGIQDTLNSIAERLGATIGNYAVSIGARSSGWISVSGSGSANVADKSWKQKNVGGDLIYDGKDMEQAIKVALMNAIQDGAIQGIRAATQRLLQSGKDIESQLSKAVDFEAVFTRLRGYKDPIGAALDTLDKEFNRLKGIFTEAGASSAEWAQLEELYGIERAQAIKDAQSRVSGALKALLDDLNVGDNGLSLKDRRTNARAIYDPLKARVAAGDVTAYDDFAAAARTLLDIERQISGSQTGYFTLFDEVRGISQAQINAQNALIDAASGRNSPFSNSTVPVNDNQPVVDAINGLGTIMTAVNQNLITFGRNLGTSTAQGSGSTNYYANARQNY